MCINIQSIAILFQLQSPLSLNYINWYIQLYNGRPITNEIYIIDILFCAIAAGDKIEQHITRYR